MTRRQVRRIEAKRFDLMRQMLSDQITSIDRADLAEELARTERQLDQAAQEYVFEPDLRDHESRAFSGHGRAEDY